LAIILPRHDTGRNRDDLWASIWIARSARWPRPVPALVVRLMSVSRRLCRRTSPRSDARFSVLISLVYDEDLTIARSLSIPVGYARITGHQANQVRTLVSSENHGHSAESYVAPNPLDADAAPRLAGVPTVLVARPTSTLLATSRSTAVALLSPTIAMQMATSKSVSGRSIVLGSSEDIMGDIQIRGPPHGDHACDDLYLVHFLLEEIA